MLQYVFPSTGLMLMMPADSEAADDDSVSNDDE